MKLVSGKELADLLGFHPKTVEKWARCGSVPGAKCGGRWRFNVEKVKKWLGLD